MEYNGQGCFNDLDMLIVGMNGEGNVAMGGCTPEEYALHFAFWCFFGSPLMIGSDLSKLDETSLRLLTNPDLIRIDQDSAYRQPFFLAPLEKNTERTTDQHYYKDYPGHAPLLARILDDGSVAIGLFNMLQKTLLSKYFSVFCAGGVVVAIPISILFVIMQKFYVEGITGGAVKG